MFIPKLCAITCIPRGASIPARAAAAPRIPARSFFQEWHTHRTYDWTGDMVERLPLVQRDVRQIIFELEKVTADINEIKSILKFSQLTPPPATQEKPQEEVLRLSRNLAAVREVEASITERLNSLKNKS